MGSISRLIDRAAPVIARPTGIRPNAYAVRFVMQDATEARAFAFDRSRGRALDMAADAASDLPSWFGVSQRHFGVGPVQVPSEIGRLIEAAASNGTALAGEIGAHDAGTSLLFSQCLPGLRTLFVIDLYVKNRWKLRRVAPEGQEVVPVDGDSSHPRTVARVTRKLGQRQFDFLLIDGDHEYDGVRRDFLAYRSLVRPGGLIAFHDIMPVTAETNRWVGGVPTFWNEVKEHYRHEEFVDDPAQEGLGIGVLWYDPGVTPAL